MLTTEQLRALMADIESDHVERTTSTKNTDKFGEAICAFANDFPNHKQPGYLLVGVDNNGNASGLKATDELLLDLSALRSNVNLEPLPAMTIQKYILPEGDVAVVEVLPSDLPPARYKGRVWIRIGPSRRGANQQEERLLIEKRTALQKTFDVRPCPGCAIEDLVLDLFLVTYRPAAVAREVIAENNRDVKEQMASLRFYDLAANCPTHAGVLLFAKDPLRWIPGAYIQFVRWAGTALSDEPIRDKRFSGDLLTVLRELEGFPSLLTQAHPVPASDSVLRERMEIDYPPVAIRELLWNAVMHRSYE
ncbi:MAG: RNA-binding domain-containing protein, partial [Gammaproteobacteria bacterium]